MTVPIIIRQQEVGSAITVERDPEEGKLVRGTRIPVPTPEYWWRADSGLSTSGWTAVNGGLNFTFFNVTTANSTVGALFSRAASSYGATPNLSSNIDVRHVFIRFDSLDRTTGNAGILGGSQASFHGLVYSAGAGYFWKIGETLFSPFGGTSTYSEWNTANVGTTGLWFDFVNGVNNELVNKNRGNNIYIYANNDTNTIYKTETVDGIFNSRLRWESGYSLYLARRGTLYGGMYVKELALFTSRLDTIQGRQFFNSMFTRWP